MPALLLLLLAALAAGCGDGDGGVATTGRPVDPAATTAPAEAGGDRGGERGGAEDPGADGSSGADGSPGDGSGADDPGEGDPGADGSGETVPEPDFAAELRGIVTEALEELRPLARVSVAVSDPDAYSVALSDAIDAIDGTLERLRALDPPADAEPGTTRIIAAFTALRAAATATALDFESDNPGRMASGLRALRRAAVRFGARLRRATEVLRDAGYGAAAS